MQRAGARKVHRAEYDPVLKDIDAYLSKLVGKSK